MKKLVLLSLVLVGCPLPGIAIPPGVIDCGISEISELAVSLIDDVRTCIGNGKTAGCDTPAPSNPVNTTCTWKQCLWNLAKSQGKSHAVEGVLCAVDQAGMDFGTAAVSTGDVSMLDGQEKADEFVAESGAKLKHRQ